MNSFAMLKVKIKFVRTELRQIDFANITFHDEDSTNFIILKIRNIKKEKVYHTHKSINRCCTRSEYQKTVFHDYDSLIKDNIPRISCNIDKQLFFESYIEKRVAVMLTGCQEGWQSKQWTFEGMIHLKQCIFLFHRNISW